MTYTIDMPGEASFDKMTVKLTEDGSLHQSAGASWGEHIYKVNSDGTVSYYMKRDGVWVEGEGYDTVEAYENGNYGDNVGMMKALPGAAVYNSSFVFQEETNSYKGTIDFMGAPMEFEAKFENKKLVYCNIGGMLVIEAYQLRLNWYLYADRIGNCLSHQFHDRRGKTVGKRTASHDY